MKRRLEKIFKYPAGKLKRRNCMAKRAIIVFNGDLSQGKISKKPGDLLIAADAGAEKILKQGLKPDIVIGDLDSLKSKLKSTPQIKYPADKDWTDSELALEYAVKQGCQEIIINGFLGRRLDHLISNLFVLENLAKRGIKIRIEEADQQLWLVTGSLRLSGRPGELISLIPLSRDCLGVTTTGLKWRLNNERLKCGFGRGVSNVINKENVKISLKSGCLLVVKTNQFGAPGGI